MPAPSTVPSALANAVVQDAPSTSTSTTNAATTTNSKQVKEKETKAKKGAKPKEAPATGSSTLLSWLAPKSTPAAPATPKKADPTPVEQKEESKPASSSFDQTFKPFRVKNGFTLAPINHFKSTKARVIVLDDEEGPESKTRFNSATHRDTHPLRTLLAEMPPSSKPRKTAYGRPHDKAPAMKTSSRVLVRDLIEKLNDATAAGDVYSAKILISTLSDRRQLPVRWLYFYENTRPMYVGTWTRTSNTVGPRTPFAMDENLDYTYDSGEEWFEEEEGEEMDDTETIEEEDEELDDENNDWIVDDDVDELEPNDEGGLVTLGDSPKGKRKAESGPFGWLGMNKRRKLVPLKPDCKGPYWETTLGTPELSSWSRYCVRVLNDVPLYIDPLASYHDPPAPAAKSADGFAIPAIPDRLLPTASASTSNPAASALASTAGPAKKRASAKATKDTPMLSDKLAHEMAKLVLESETGLTQQSIVDTVYLKLKGAGAKKNAIQATMKTAFVKDKNRWILKDEYKSLAEGP